MVSHSGLITVMTRAARKAAPRLRRDFGEVEQLQVSRKGPADFVSMADAGTSFYVKASGGPDIQSLADLCGHTVAVERGTTWSVSPKCMTATSPTAGRKASRIW